MTYGLLIYWAFLTVVTVVGGAIGGLQLRTDRHRVSLFLSRIIIAEAFRSLLTFISLLLWADIFRTVPIYVALSALSATLLAGAIWGWLAYLRGWVNGSGWRGLLDHLKGGSSMSDDKDKEKVDDESPKPKPAPAPDTGGGTNAQTGSDTGGVTDGPGKTP